MVLCELCGLELSSRNKLFKHLKNDCPAAPAAEKQKENHSQVVVIGYLRNPAAAEAQVIAAIEAVAHTTISIATRASRPNDMAAAPEASCAAVCDIMRVGYKSVEPVTADALNAWLGQRDDVEATTRVRVHSAASLPVGVTSLHASQG